MDELITRFRGWHNFGILLRRLDRPADCLDAQQRALAAYGQSGLALPAADCHVGVGMALHDLGEPAGALEPYAAARALYTEFGAQHLLADVDDRRGLALCDLGRYEEAELAHAGAIERFELLDDRAHTLPPSPWPTSTGPAARDRARSG